MSKSSLYKTSGYIRLCAVSAALALSSIVPAAAADLGGNCCADLEDRVRRPHAELLVQQGVELVVVVLAGVHRQQVVGGLQTTAEHAGLDDLRASAVTEREPGTGH